MEQALKLAMPGSLSGHERAGSEKPALQASGLLHKSADPYRNREDGLERQPDVRHDHPGLQEMRPAERR